MPTPKPAPKPAPKPDPKDDAKNRFVQDGDEGITINGMSIDEYLKHPDTKAAIAKGKAGGPAAPVNGKGNK